MLTASDGTEALALYADKKNEIAVVLTDMVMPFMDGPAGDPFEKRPNRKNLAYPTPEGKQQTGSLYAFRCKR